MSAGPGLPVPERAVGEGGKSKLGLRDLFSYAVAQIGSSLFFHVPLLILMPFMTNHLAMPAALAGAVIFLPKIWVVFCDPLMGTWSDRWRSSAGRRRPFVLWGGIATACSFVMLFSAPSLDNPYLTGALVAALYLVGSTAYSSFSVPYLAMASEIAPRQVDVTLVTSWRMAFNFIGAFVSGLAPLLVQKLGGGRMGYLGMSACLALVCLLSVLLFYAGTRHLPVTQAARAVAPERIQWRAIYQNRPFRVLLQTYCIQLLGIGIIQSAFAYFVIYRLKSDLASLSGVVLVMTLGSLVAQPVWINLAKRYGKLHTYRIAIVAMMCAEAMFLLPGAGDLGMLYIACGCVGLASAGYTLMAWSSMYDIVAADTAATGVQRAGTYTGIWSAAEKVAIALGVLSTGVLLQAFGFHPSKAGFVPQSELALAAVRFVPGVLPAALLALSLLSLSRFKPPAPAATLQEATL